MDSDDDGVIGKVLTTLFQLGIIVVVKACGFLLIAFIAKWYARRNPDKFPKFQVKDQNTPKLIDEFNYDSDWDWDDVGAADVPNASTSKVTDSDVEDEEADKFGSTRTDEWMSETDKLLATIRRRRMKDDMIKENLFLGQNRKFSARKSKATPSTREMLAKYKPK